MQEPKPAGERAIPRLELPQTLGVVVPPGQDIAPVWNLLIAAGFSVDEGAGRMPLLVDAGAESIEALPDWLKQHPDGHVLMLFNAPVPTLAQYMADAVEPGEAVAQWRQHAEQALGVVRHNRRRMTLIALEAAQADPGAFIDLLGDRFGLALKRPLNTIEAGEAPGAVFRMMAENAVWQSTDVRNLATELEANALPMPPSHGLLLPAVEEVYSEFNTLVGRTRAHNEADKAELEKARQLLKDREQENGQDQVRKKDLEEENELLLQQLHHVQEELESYFLENRDLQRKLDEAQKQKTEFEVQAQIAQNGLAAICSSISWKITAPLRFLAGPFMRGNKAASRQQQSES